MVGFEQAKEQLAELGVQVFAGSVDSLDDAGAVQQELSFPVAHSVDRGTADALGAYWNNEREFMQPTQFLLKKDGSIVQATYSDGPLGRILAEDVCRLVAFLTKN